ncbi:MAG TPA: hypothetical protein VF245_00675 [Solirubrobacterales bacterium]
MSGRTPILLATAAIAIAAVAILLLGGGAEESSEARGEPPSSQPSVQVISPRNGARQASHAVVVKVDIHNFRLAPRHFGGEPQLGEGNLRFGLNRVPDCVDPVKLQRAIESPFGKGRLIGKSFDFPRYSGPNGVLAERIGSAGSYSPATRPEIYYHDLRSGFYRLVIALAENDGSPTPFHAVTNFQVLNRSGYGPKCTGGKVPSVKAAAFG